MESKSTLESGESSEGRTAYAAQVELALMGTIKELLKEHREMIARLMHNGAASAPLPAPVDGGPTAELIAQYRAIRSALALPDDEAALDAATRTSSMPIA